MRSSWIVIPKSDDKCPYKRHTEANHREQRTRPREDRDRDWSDVATSQGMPAAPEDGRGKERILPYSLRREPSPAHVLILDFWSPEPPENKFLLL